MRNHSTTGSESTLEANVLYDPVSVYSSLPVVVPLHLTSIQITWHQHAAMPRIQGCALVTDVILLVRRILAQHSGYSIFFPESYQATFEPVSNHFPIA